MNPFAIFLALTLPMFKFSIAEECIRFRKHRNELMNCCDIMRPFPTEPKMNACENYANKNMNSYGECLFQCLYEGIGIVKENIIDQVKIAEYLKSLDEDTQQFLLEAHVECSEMSKAEQVGPCNSFAFNVVSCVLDRLHTDCPENHYHPSPMCDKQRDGAEVCY